jgi:hypothetical protein
MSIHQHVKVKWNLMKFKCGYTDNDSDFSKLLNTHTIQLKIIIIIYKFVNCSIEISQVMYMYSLLLTIVYLKYTT